MAEKAIQQLRKILDESKYTVAMCGSGMLEEGGTYSLKMQERAYDIEKRYGISPEVIMSSMYYNTRQTQFFEFYKNEVLGHKPAWTSSFQVLSAMEQQGKLQCTITSNIYEQAKQSGCQSVINLRGSIYNNWCPHCRKHYSIEYVQNAKKIPMCEDCHRTIRPLISLFGEMVDSQLMTRATEEFTKADVLLLLGTSLKSETFSSYIRYFNGRNIVIIHRRENFWDKRANLVILDHPKNILNKLGYCAELPETEEAT